MVMIIFTIIIVIIIIIKYNIYIITPVSAQSGTPQYNCSYIDYFEYMDRDGLGPTDAIIREFLTDLF